MRIKSLLLSLSAIAALSAGMAHAASNLVSNGNFESTTNGTNKQLSSSITNDADRSTLTGWTSSNGNDGGYNFVLNSSIATTDASAIWLKSENNNWAKSANGGNFFASDSQYWPGVLSQTITGLTAGSKYTLTFDTALAQQVGFNGANSNNYWQVVFGNSTQNSSALSIASGGFSGWSTSSMTFTATGATQVLSFLAQGSPGAPPFLLLDSVSLTAAVPEPSTWGMMAVGLGLVGFATRRRTVARALN
ncbi:PEPxxWA-CTERM sorting domain-containing protein [Duganella sp. sic0402]|uniref:PEPxxWA-CTERM sorting domain-containing protein n=1 Tax=Duganella sp. sic0402 TaxID=2854786 RepID=UPI001C44573E|nr:PEPxxWA-CTERM sorting domain-containing protein [Duganella sp. sic0402]MBV7534233.1 PEPxxWA-CTERM sorting domain-containing protein [Duganella sp. sic0402]